MRMIWKSGSDEIGQVLTRESHELNLTLEPSELEALLARMLSCSTRRASSNRPRRSRTSCRRRTGSEWCRYGERTAGGERYLATKYG